MRFNVFKNTALLFVLILISCASKTKNNLNETNTVLAKTETTIVNTTTKSIIVGANQTEAYLPLLKGKRVGIVANQTSVLFKNVTSSKTPNYDSNTHIVDTLLDLQVAVKKVFAPEHGFRGTADAGELVKDGIDTKTNLPIISLYGNNKKPTVAQLQDVDVVIFDIQDVGARFYTYISSLHYVMEACAEQNKTLIVLDRPNPNGHYIDGPILEKEHTSFVGMHPVPVVHGLTIGEYAQMINGENWLNNELKCNLKVITLKNYNRQMAYDLPIKPSPNLPNDTSINLYPSLCFFEGTNVSVGRGTHKQFQVYGSPYLYKDYYTFKFVPQPNEGAKTPPHQGKMCFGKDLSNSEALSALDLSFLIEAYNHTVDKKILKLLGLKVLKNLKTCVNLI